jgi:hypothetical protein
MILESASRDHAGRFMERVSRRGRGVTVPGPTLAANRPKTETEIYILAS